MVKHHSIFLTLLCFSLRVCAQPTSEDYATKVLAVQSMTSRFLSIGGGLNSNFGLVGWGFEGPISQKITAEGSVGLSTWGFKFHGEIKLYLKENYEGFSFGLGFGRNSGLSDFDLELETEPDKELQTVTMDLNPLNSINVSVCRVWRLGKRRRHKFFIQSGFVARTSDRVYNVKSDHTLSPQSIYILKTLAPGGVTLGVGFCFGL